MNVDEAYLPRIRRYHLVSQTEIAKALNMTQSNVARIERAIEQATSSGTLEERNPLSRSQKIAWLKRCGHYQAIDLSLYSRMPADITDFEMQLAIESVKNPFQCVSASKPLAVIWGNEPEAWHYQTLMTRSLLAASPPEGFGPYLPNARTPCLWRHIAERPRSQGAVAFLSKTNLRNRQLLKKEASSYRPVTFAEASFAEEMKGDVDYYSGESVLFANANFLRYFDVIQIPYPSNPLQYATAAGIISRASLSFLVTARHVPSGLTLSMRSLRYPPDALVLSSPNLGYLGFGEGVAKYVGAIIQSDTEISIKFFGREIATLIYDSFSGWRGKVRYGHDAASADLDDEISRMARYLPQSDPQARAKLVFAGYLKDSNRPDTTILPMETASQMMDEMEW